MAAEGFRAIVVGATGATGRELVVKLANRANCTQVRAIVRRQVDVTSAFPGIGEGASKISLIVTDLDNLAAQQDHFVGCDVAFSCIGTSRANDEVKAKMEKDGADAGFAAWLEKVDLGYSKAFAEVAAKAGVKHLSRVSARGADSKNMGSGFNIYHRYQGLADEAVLALADKFSHGVTCFRPGLLNRGDLVREHETEYLKKHPSLEVGQLAEGLLREWDRRQKAPASSTGKVIDLKEIVELVGGDPAKY